MHTERKRATKLTIANELRDEIITGGMTPGARLETRRALASSYGTTLVTVQNALAGLEQEGFIVSKGKSGTFVADKPPHLCQFALVFPTDPNGPNWVMYWDHLAAAARRVIKEQGLRLTIYTGVDVKLDSEDLHNLEAAVRDDLLAGLIFASNPFPVADSIILNKPGIPRVMISSPGKHATAMGHVGFAGKDFAAKVVASLRKNGVKSTGIIGQPGNVRDRLLTALEEAGISCPYQNIQAVDLGNRQWAKNIARLMFDGGNTNRPDGLVIMDDNLFDPALAGILDAGLRVPEDLTIVTHSNFPWQVNCPVPVTRVGYDMDALLRLCISELVSQREGNAPQDRILPAVLESELPMKARG